MEDIYKLYEIAQTKIQILTEDLEKQRKQNLALREEIGALKAQLKKAQEPAPIKRNERGAGRKGFDESMRLQMRKFKELREKGTSKEDIMGLMDISKSTYYNYLREWKNLYED